ncbi:hypothetical protein K2173_011923 [Erythroxylum novogranatense]|uniref:Uncharacterized protein n=1 Tax=Erythroxylum novogranatense TaxID=1862640 RepID=A0AAV8TGY7_9ROSI|nr:hypothetical protein K2173_011923 [Erythroxylum novogranatense]
MANPPLAPFADFSPHSSAPSQPSPNPIPAAVPTRKSWKQVVDDSIPITLSYTPQVKSTGSSLFPLTWPLFRQAPAPGTPPFCSQNPRRRALAFQQSASFSPTMAAKSYIGHYQGEGHLCSTGALDSTIDATGELESAPLLVSTGARHSADTSIAVPPRENGHSTPLVPSTNATGGLASGSTSVSAEASPSEATSLDIVPALPPLFGSDPSGAPVHAASQLPVNTDSALVPSSSPPTSLGGWSLLFVMKEGYYKAVKTSLSDIFVPIFIHFFRVGELRAW